MKPPPAPSPQTTVTGEDPGTSKKVRDPLGPTSTGGFGARTSKKPPKTLWQGFDVGSVNDPGQRVPSSTGDHGDTSDSQTLSRSPSPASETRSDARELPESDDPTEDAAPAAGDIIPPLKESTAAKEWERQKAVEGASDQSIDKIMGMIGLEAVKENVLAIKAKIETSKRQGVSLKKDRFNCSFLGNPGMSHHCTLRMSQPFTRHGQNNHRPPVLEILDGFRRHTGKWLG